jgi:hypothetical protein
MTTAGEQNPRRGHYVWYGPQFPFMNRVAIESALLRSGLDELWLWHADPLAGQPHFDALCADARVKARPLSAATLFELADGSEGFDSQRLSTIYDAVRSHVTRSNIARAAALYFHGGVYFDIDTLCCQSFLPLLDGSAFLGNEFVFWPERRRSRRDLYRFVWGPLLGPIRSLTAALPGGDRLHQRTRGLYQTAVNGAILGAPAGHPFLRQLLDHSARIPEASWQVPHVLGTHVLQRAVAAYRGQDLRLLDPSAFFPLGPVISRQYFKKRADPSAAIQRIVSGETFAIHWYASVSDLSKLGPEQLAAMSEDTVFGKLCQGVVRERHLA